jgi:N-acetyltransferase
MSPSPAKKNQPTLLGFFSKSKPENENEIGKSMAHVTPIRSRVNRIAKKKDNRTFQKTLLVVTKEIRIDEDKLAKKAPKKKLTQLCIDAGQSDFKSVTCKLCEMVYMFGEPSDEAMHKKFCCGEDKSNKKKKDFARPTQQYVQYKGYKNERVVKTLDDAKIILITDADSHTFKKKALEARAVIDTDLGVNDGEEHVHHTYLHVESGKVTGCIIAERITHANRIIVEGNENLSDLDIVNGMIFTDSENIPAVCGISRMWVHSSHRRKQIASKLIDAARESIVYGYDVPITKLAFSQPTTDGKLFARKYTGTDKFLVYHK